MWRRSSRLRQASERDQIISQDSLWAVLQVATYIKENPRTLGLFRSEGRPDVRSKILSCLQRGDPDTRLKLDDAAVESAAALLQFIADLRVPLIPSRIQNLIMAENKDVAVQQIACDALGLIKQDLTGRHLVLVSILLDMLREVTKNCRNNSEMFGCNLPVVFLPVFFRLETNELSRWKDLATVFSEIISNAPDWLSCSTHASSREILHSTHRHQAVVGFIDVNLAGRLRRAAAPPQLVLINIEDDVVVGQL